MNSKQFRTLEAVFTDPVPAAIEWAAIESLLRSAMLESSSFRSE